MNRIFIFAVSLFFASASAWANSVEAEPTTCRKLLRANEIRQDAALFEMFPLPINGPHQVEFLNLRHRFLARVRAIRIENIELKKILNPMLVNGPTVRDYVDTLTRELVGRTEFRQTLDLGTASELENFLNQKFLWKHDSQDQEFHGEEELFQAEIQADKVVGDLAILTRWLELSVRDEITTTEIERRKVFGRMIDLASELLAIATIPHEVVARTKGAAVALRPDGFKIKYTNYTNRFYDPVAAFENLKRVEADRSDIVVGIASELAHSPVERGKEEVRRIVVGARDRAFAEMAEFVALHRRDFYWRAKAENFDRLTIEETKQAIIGSTRVVVLAAPAPYDRTVGRLLIPANHSWVRFEHPDFGYRPPESLMVGEYLIPLAEPNKTQRVIR